MIQTLLALILFTTTSLFAGDSSLQFEEHMKKNEYLKKEDFKDTEIIFIPGIVSEVFNNNFGSQLNHYKNVGIKASLITSSSQDVKFTIARIEKKITELSSKNQKAIFVTHSLGGLALLDWMMDQEPSRLTTIKSIVFLQAPFYGSPVASVYFENPYYVKTIIGPFTPLFKTSEKTIKYLSLEERQAKMNLIAPRIPELFSSIKVITMSGKMLDGDSVFNPSNNIIRYGCVTYLAGACRSKQIFDGPLDFSDGMVPLKNSKLENINYVVIPQVDHAETVMLMPFKDINRVLMTDVLIRMVTVGNNIARLE